MTTAQKVIKYLAIAFAIFLIVNIVSAIMYGLYAFANLLGLTKENETSVTGTTIMANLESKNIEEMEIDIEFADLTIKNGEYFRIETNNENIKCENANKSIQIKEKSNNWFRKNENIGLTIYIPENFEFEKVKITTGAGKVDIEEIVAQELSFEIGAGETKINKLVVADEANIEGGAGKITIESGKINNLDLDMGVGKVEITTLLTGKSQINAGIGSLDIKINAEKENYKTKISKGIGSVRLNGEECSDGDVYGKGENEIKIDGGIGNIDIEFEK